MSENDKKLFFPKTLPSDVQFLHQDGGGILMNNDGKFFFSSISKEKLEQLYAENFDGTLVTNFNDISVIGVLNQKSPPRSEIQEGNENRTTIIDPVGDKIPAPPVNPSPSVTPMLTPSPSLSEDEAGVYDIDLGNLVQEDLNNMPEKESGISTIVINQPQITPQATPPPTPTPSQILSNRILIVGDSITVDNGYTWSSLFKKENKNTEILAIGGKQLTLWMKPQLDIKLKNNKYGKVYIYGGVNDAFSSKKASVIVASLQYMVNQVRAAGAQPYVIVGYDSDRDMEVQKMYDADKKKIYIKTVDGWIPLLEEYKKYQDLILTSIKGAIIIPRISIGVLGDGFHPTGKQPKALYDHIKKY